MASIGPTSLPQNNRSKRATKAEIVGGTPAENAEITKGILAGEITGAKRDIVLLNAGLGFLYHRKTETMEDGVKMAQS